MARNRKVDRPLRRDVRLLGRILGEVLVRHEGAPFLELEERVRALAIRRRRGPRAERPAAAAELERVLGSLPPDRVEPVLRAFSTYFALANLAEQHHRVRRARAHAIAGDRPQRGSLAAVLEQIRDAGVPAGRARAAIAALEVTLTFTAHPTQAARRTVLEKLYRIHERLEERDRCELTPAEKARGLASIAEEIDVLWQTDELRHERPTVADEVKNVLWYLEQLWDLLPTVDDALAAAFERAYGEPLGLGARPIHLHSWVGGDMDGNPYVTPGVLEDTVRAMHVRGLRRLLAGVRDLGARLSHSWRLAPPPASLVESMEADEERVGLPSSVGEGEPWRRKLRFVEARLERTLEIATRRRAARRPGAEKPGAAGQPSAEEEEATGEVAAAGAVAAREVAAGAAAAEEPEAEEDRAGVDGIAYAGAAELAADLEVVAGSLREAGGAGAGRVEALLEHVRGQGPFLAELEMRVPAEDARQAAAELAAGAREENRSGAGRLLEALRRIARLQWETGEPACRTLILSMTESAGDVLAALACARACGLSDPSGSSVHLDLVPLFETRAALEGSARIVRELLADGAYLRHVRARGVQEVMIGYSDSGKEVGLLAASAELRRAQLELPRVAAEARVGLRIFHGRGESVARGGGPAQQAILGLPPGSVSGRYKATEQGEALDHKYARPELALRTLELTLGGALLHTLSAQPAPPPGDEARYDAVFSRLAAAGRRVYQELVRDPSFVEFFAAATPIDAIARLPIGSRPSKRKAGGIEALRAIPWVFAWTQNRSLLPGWYGVGTALHELGDEALLREMYGAWPFFRAVIDNVEMVLAKSDLAITESYARLAPADVRDRVWPVIRAEHVRTRRHVKRVTRSRRLLDGHPSLQRSIALRNPYVDPMSFLQVGLLARERAGDPDCERPLLISLAGIASGMRNTG